MKKFLATFTCAVLAALTAVCFTACNPETDPGKVNLVAIPSAAEVLARDDIDYFVVPEPAASVRVKATANSNQKLNLVGDLQKLYGGTNGYPQAVIVAKNSVISGATSVFVDKLKESINWLSDDSTEISDIVTAVSSHLPSGTTPTFNANNLTKPVIANCGIRFTGAGEGKTEVKSFLTALKAVQPAVNDNPADKFFQGDFPADATKPQTLSVYAPDGAPALALAGLMAGAIDASGAAETINYNIVNATTIKTYVTGESPVADICILPVNLAANLLGTGEKYSMLGTVTHGNLYILSAKTDEEITADNISSLLGKTVGVVNLAEVPGLTLKLILNKYNVEYSENS